MILTFVRLHALTEKRKELRQTLHSLNMQMKTEAGCLDSNLYQLDEDKNHFLVVESWENREALNDYLHSIYFTVLMGARSLLSRPPEITIHTISHSSELETAHLRL